MESLKGQRNGNYTLRSNYGLFGITFATERDRKCLVSHHTFQ